jgi:cell division transport system ATP-binding protein
MVDFQGVSRLYVRRGGGAAVHALRDVTFQVAAGELVLVTGPTGAGKSTVLRLICGEERPSEGRLVVDGEDVPTLGRRGRARLRRRLGVVLEDSQLLGDRTVLGNVALVLWALGGGLRAARARALESLEEAGLASRASAFPRELTASERQRLLIARALAGDPCLLLVDEPTAGLDAEATRAVVAMFRDARDQGTTVVVASQLSALAVVLGARTLVLEEGRLRPGPVVAVDRVAPAPPSPPSRTDARPGVGEGSEKEAPKVRG